MPKEDVAFGPNSCELLKKDEEAWLSDVFPKPAPKEVYPNGAPAVEIPKFYDPDPIYED